MKEQPKDGDAVNLSKKIEVPEPLKTKWQPSPGDTKTMEYGKGSPTPSPSLDVVAQMDVSMYYPYLLKDSPEYNRRVREQLAKYAES